MLKRMPVDILLKMLDDFLLWMAYREKNESKEALLQRLGVKTANIVSSSSLLWWAAQGQVTGTQLTLTHSPIVSYASVVAVYEFPQSRCHARGVPGPGRELSCA